MTDAELLAGNEPTLNGKKLSQIYAEQMAHRLAANCFDIFEAAKAIAVQLGYDKSTEEELRDDMSQAAHEGTLTVRSPRGHDQYAPTRPPSTTYGFDCLVTPDDVNEWATKRRLSWRWRVQAPAQSPAAPAPVEDDEIDFSLVATRQELIDAFGTFTGMDRTWFDNLTDTPKLKAARKFTGQGGRHSAEPLFCPYAVMQWLADPKRKKGRPLNDTTAWRLLKSHFPKVHNQYLIGDPNAD